MLRDRISINPFMKVIITGLLSLLMPVTVIAANLKMVYFYEKNCGWCKQMEAVLSDPAIKAILSRNAGMMRIDIKSTDRKERELVSKYAVRGVPTIIFLNDRSEELLRIPGLLTKKDFLDLICENFKEISDRERECQDR